MNDRFSCKTIFLALALSFWLPSLVWAAPVKNVIVLMTDGTGATHTTLTRWYLGGQLLPQDPYVVGAVRTYGADSIITDSAPAASAFATGHKTDDKFISVLPPKSTIPGVEATPLARQYKPVATVLEGAKLQGKAVGLVATSNIQHASPAAFSAHWPDRSNYEEIGKQQVYLDIDVVLSGGSQYLLPQNAGGSRKDGANLYNVLKQRGYAIAATSKEMQAAKSHRLWGLFASNDLDYDMDRTTLHPEQPSLAEMTAKAIETLSQNPKGFFLFVEASKVDWASHANDPIGVISDSVAYANAIRTALDFAKKDGQTLVLCFADHSNGGLAIGSKKSDKTYDHMPYENLVAPLRRATLTAEGVATLLNGDRSAASLREYIQRYYGVDDLSDEEINRLQQAPGIRFNTVLGHLLSERSILAWTTTGHTGEDVMLYAYGPNKPSGLIENTRLATLCAESMGFNLDEVDQRLYVEATSLFAPLGASISLETNELADPTLVVRRGAKEARLPCSTDLLLYGDKTYQLDGITVYAPNTGRTYVSRQAAEILAKQGF